MSRFGLEVTQWAALNPDQQGELLRRPVTTVPGLGAKVSAIIARVRAGGDEALAQLTQEFDGMLPRKLAVSAEELRQAEQAVNSRLRAAIRDAGDRIREFHAADIPRERTVETAAGLRCTVTYLPQSVVGIYVPGGSAPLVSTVLMLAIPARLAGCPEIIMCSPPGPGGTISAEVLAAASQCDVDRVFCLGGAQAIAAMAYGTATVPKCSKIFGPGNAWVTEAKQQVAQDPQGAAIDMPAGPSEVMVIADAQAGEDEGAELIAWDLLAQAEHGTDSQVILLTDSHELATSIIARLDELMPSLPRAAILQKSLSAARFVLVADLNVAIDIANTYAPEHLILNTCNASSLAARVRHAGSVFLGRWTPESLGDYCSGPNHVLPTYGFARAHGALGVGDFMRRMTLQEASPEALQNLGPVAELLAQTEGLDAHRMAIRARLARLESRA